MNSIHLCAQKYLLSEYYAPKVVLGVDGATSNKIEKFSILNEVPGRNNT